MLTCHRGQSVDEIEVSLQPLAQIVFSLSDLQYIIHIE